MPIVSDRREQMSLVTGDCCPRPCRPCSWVTRG